MVECRGKVFDSGKVTGRRVETFCIAVSLHSLSLCQFIQLEGDIINLLHPPEWPRFNDNTRGKPEERNTRGHLRFFDVLLRCIFLDS